MAMADLSELLMKYYTFLFKSQKVVAIICKTDHFINLFQHHKISKTRMTFCLSFIKVLIVFQATIVMKAATFSINTSQHRDSQKTNDPKICDGNRFKHISTYALGRQNDLNLTIGVMTKQTHVEKVVYKDQLFRTYTIFPLTLNITYSEGSQTATTVGFDRIKISGGYLKIQYSFNWQKKQLGSISGTGNGSVRSDPITFIKSLDINAETKTFEWTFVSAEPIKISNSLTISQIKPYKAADYDAINQMLNELKSGDPTVKTNLVAALNANFTKILAKFVQENNETWKQPQKIFYTYTDYHGDFSLTYDSIMLNFSLAQGLDLLLSQSIQNDSNFECGEKVPTEPQNVTDYGGLQQYISNTFIKSTLRNALSKGFLDVVLTQQFWQSPAFQFYMGDVHDVIPSTKNISSLQPITGRCRALNDKYFNFDTKNKTKTELVYLVSVNFTCDLKIFNNTKRLVGVNLAVDYDIKINALPNTVDVVVQSVTGTPTFFQEQEYKIKNMELALYMIDQTLKTIGGTKVLGSGFKVMNRKYPKAEIRQKYLFLYDSAAINKVQYPKETPNQQVYQGENELKEL